MNSLPIITILNIYIQKHFIFYFMVHSVYFILLQVPPFPNSGLFFLCFYYSPERKCVKQKITTANCQQKFVSRLFLYNVQKRIWKKLRFYLASLQSALSELTFIPFPSKCSLWTDVYSLPFKVLSLNSLWTDVFCLNVYNSQKINEI